MVNHNTCTCIEKSSYTRIRAGAQALTKNTFVNLDSDVWCVGLLSLPIWNIHLLSQIHVDSSIIVIASSARYHPLWAKRMYSCTPCNTNRYFATWIKRCWKNVRHVRTQSPVPFSKLSWEHSPSGSGVRQQWSCEGSPRYIWVRKELRHFQQTNFNLQFRKTGARAEMRLKE